MAIVKYTFKNGQYPSGITDHGHFKHPVDKTLIGIGDAGRIDSEYKTELTKAQLIAYVKTLPNYRVIEMREHNNLSTITTNRVFTEAELETMANDWCTARGIS